MIRIFVAPCGKTYNEQHKAAYELLGAAMRLCGYEQAEIKKTENGKPYFENSDVFFSISHTDGICAVALGESPCGIDIENKREISKKIRDRYLDGCDEREALKEWTKKESYGKMTGEGFFFKEEKPSNYRFFELEGCFLTVCAPKNSEISSEIEKL